MEATCKVLNKITSFHSNWTTTCSPQAILASDWLNRNLKIFSSETRWHNELLLCRNDVCEILFKISIVRADYKLIWPPQAVLVFDWFIKKIFSETIWLN